jgi:DNA uptake protein ComE-like DNA-binding protein
MPEMVFCSLNLKQPGHGNVFGLFFVGIDMTLKRMTVSLIAVIALGLCAHSAMAYEHKADRSAVPAANASSMSGKALTKKAPSNVKAGPKVKLVDINTANKSTLMKLPGITDTDADKIIANRPYGSKAWLVTNKVVGAKTYGAIKTLIEAKQALKSAEKKATKP